LIVRVNVVLNRTVVVDSDLRFDNMCSGHLQVKVSCITPVDGINNPSTDVIQLTLTLKMTTAQVVETLVTVNNNSPIQDQVHPDDRTQLTFV